MRDIRTEIEHESLFSFLSSLSHGSRFECAKFGGFNSHESRRHARSLLSRSHARALVQISSPAFARTRVTCSRSGAPTATASGGTPRHRSNARLGRVREWGFNVTGGYVRAVRAEGGSPPYPPGPCSAPAGALARLVTRDSTSHLTGHRRIPHRRRGYPSRERRAAIRCIRPAWNS